jgi:glycosyltransferase involved in cell wall biosynthesis
VSAHFGVPRANITVLYPGIDLDDILDATPYDVSSPVILTGGRLEEYKQVDLAISALPFLPAPAHLTVLGDGPCLARLKQLATTLGVRERVSFLGRLDTPSVYRWQRTASVYLTLSRHESFGLAPLESLAAGARVVATDIPAFREMSRIIPDRTAFLPVRPSPEDIADAVLGQLDAPRTPPRLDEVPTWPKLTQDCLNIYRDLLRAPLSAHLVSR